MATSNGRAKRTRSWLDTAAARFGLPFVVLAAGILGWEVSVRSGIVNPITVPAASDTFAALIEISQTRYFWESTWLTLQETI